MLSIIVPTYNEEDVIDEFYSRITTVLDAMSHKHELIFINDGSNDTTLERLNTYHSSGANVVVIDFSRNFGKEAAMTAGIDYARGDAVVVIDADLQDPPEVIPMLVDKWNEGYDVVYATRQSRKGESATKRATSKLFYRLLTRLSSVHIPEDTGDFRLMNRKAVDSVKMLRERNRYMKGLFSWVGYKQTNVTYNRDPRYAGNTKWSYKQLWNLAIEGITSFTIAPLKLATYVGLVAAAGAFLYGLWILFKTLAYGEPVPGYPTMMVVILFLGGIQLMTLGIIGEYLGRIFIESKQRPIYIIENIYDNNTSSD